MVIGSVLVLGTCYLNGGDRERKKIDYYYKVQGRGKIWASYRNIVCNRSLEDAAGADADAARDGHRRVGGSGHKVPRGDAAPLFGLGNDCELGDHPARDITKPHHLPCNTADILEPLEEGCIVLELLLCFMPRLPHFRCSRDDNRHRTVDARDLHPVDCVADVAGGQEPAVCLGADNIQEVEFDRSAGPRNAADLGISLVRDLQLIYKCRNNIVMFETIIATFVKQRI